MQQVTNAYCPATSDFIAQLPSTSAPVSLCTLLPHASAHQRLQPENLERIAADPFTFAVPGGESQQQLELRMCEFIHRQLLPSLQYDGPPTVVVTHGLAIKW